MTKTLRSVFPKITLFGKEIPLWLVLWLLFIPATVLGNEFKVLSFNKVPDDISAIQNKFKRYDDNDELCAIVKVRSDVPNLRFSASNPIVGNVVKRQGEYWVYLSAGTRQLYVFTEGFIKLAYTFPLRIEKGTVYLLEITSVNPLGMEIGKGSLSFTSRPDSVKVTIDGFPDLVKYTPCSFLNYRTGNYRFFFQKHRYDTLDTIIHIDRGVKKNIFVRLRPKWGNLIVASLDNLPLRFQINGRTYEGKRLALLGDSLGLDAGVYALRVSREHYWDSTLSVRLVPGDTTVIVLGLKPVLTSLRVLTEPPGALVWLDGQEVGKTPFSKQVIVGRHDLHLTMKGFAEEDRRLELKKGEEKLVDVTLLRHAPVRIESVPSGAEVRINGQYRGKTPLSVELRPGPVAISLKKPFYVEQQDTLQVTGAKFYRFQLKRETYDLTVRTKPACATVFLNGKQSGSTPQTFPLVHGNYRVHVEKKGYVSRTKSVALSDDETVAFSLRRRLRGYVSAVFVIPSGNYQTTKIGGEVGWTYAQAPFFMTALGYAHGYVDDLSASLAPEVSTIDVQSYSGLSVHNLQSDGFAEETVNIFYIKAGVVISKPFAMVINGTLGVYHQSGYKVWISDDHYQSILGPDLSPGDKFMDEYGSESRNIPIFGFGYQMKLSTFYLFGDYWISNRINNKGSRFVLGVGLSF
jgi:hypothetical protein